LRKEKQLDNLVRNFVAVIEENGLIVEVAGLETGNDIISSTIVSSMEKAAKSVGMVSHLLAREDLSLGQRYKFLRRVGGNLPTHMELMGLS